MIRGRVGVGVLSAVLGLLWVSQALGDVAVLPAELANMTPEEGQAINAVFADAYAEVSTDKVTLAKGVEGDKPHSPDQTARDLGAQQYVTLRATRLSARIILTAALHSADGKELHRVRMTAASLDDIEPTAQRMAKALHDRTSTDETQTIDNVTEREGQKKNRTFSEKVMGIKTSIEYPMNGGDYQTVMNFGFDGRLEGESYFLEIGAGFALPSSGVSENDRTFGGLYTEFGADYYLTHTNVSPYLGGGVMPRLIGGDGVDFGANLAVYGQGGVMFFRKSSSRLYLDVRIAQNVTPWRETTTTYGNTPPYTEETSDARFPTELMFAVGVGW
jgi:hypothetical protein